MNKIFSKTNTGITTISLVITIVVLLILASISITIVTINGTFDKTFESRIVTELSQLAEELNKIKLDAEKDNIMSGDYSGTLSNNVLIKNKVILSTVSISNPPVKLGIIDSSKFTTDSSLGSNAKAYVSGSTLNNVIDLKDVYAINLKTNDVYYINDKIYSVNGIIGPEDLTKPLIVSEGPTVSASMDENFSFKLTFTITASTGKDNIPLKSTNKYEYFLSSKPDDIVGGNWEAYENNASFTVEQSFAKEYYLFVRIVEDEKNKISTATGSNSADVLVNGEKYHRFGPFIPNNEGLLVIGPNGGKYKNSAENTSIRQKIGTSLIINSSDVIPADGPTVTFDSNGGNISAETITAKQLFKDWTFTGEGTFENNIYTFGKGIGSLIANYQTLAIILPTPTRIGYTFDGWYTAKTGGEKIGVDGDSYIPSNNTTLYARWIINKYNIDLNFNVDKQVYSTGYNNRIYVGLKINGQDKGYVQDFYESHDYGTKWEIYGLKLDGKVISYTDSGTLGASNLNLLKYFYTIAFNVNDINYGSVSPTSLIVPNNNTKYSTNGSTLTLGDGRIVTATVKNQAGYTTTLSKWSSASGTITAKTTITANFARTTNSYTATFNSNGGTAASFASITKIYGQQLGTLPTTSKSGYAFNGWFTAPSGGSKISATTTMPANNVIYYAQWIDNTPPVIDTLTATATSASTYDLKITATDTGSGINGYYVSTSSTKPIASSAWGPSTSTSYTYKNAKPSTTYYVWVKDKDGNISNSKSIATAPINYSVNDTKWCTTLNQAYSLTVAGNTIYLLKNYTDSSSVTIERNIDIDTGKFTLTRTVQTTIKSGCSVKVLGSGYFKTNSNIILLHNSGTLTVSTNTDSSTSFCNIYNNGTVTITAGGHSNNHNKSEDVEYSGSVLSNIGTANITGGAFSKSNKTGRVLYNHTDAELNISGGTVTATNTKEWTALKNMGTCNITGGTLSSNQANTIGSDGGSTLNMNNGTVSSSSSYEYGQAIVCRGTTRIKGGKVTQTSTTGDIPAIRGEGSSVGNLVIGNGDAALNNSDPLITSHGGLAILHDAKLKFNNGRIRGKRLDNGLPFKAKTVDLRNGFKINTNSKPNNSGFYVSTLVAK